MSLSRGGAVDPVHPFAADGSLQVHGTQRAAAAMLTSIRSALAGCYVLEHELGRGATAVVYAARDLKHGRRVALKVIESSVADTLGTRRFLQEIRTTARLNHPHILPLFDSGETDGFVYYSMPLVTGESLRQRLERNGVLPLDVALPLINQIAKALSHAHSVGIVHRDLKPENVLIGEPDHVWVADFGLARALASATDQRLTGTAFAVGSPQYMSPEQAAGEGNVDARSDIYALGCVAFELLTGEPPFTAPGVGALLARHLSEPAPSARARRPDIPAAVDAALQRALAKNRSDRFEDARDFVEALGASPLRSDRNGSGRRWTRPEVVAIRTGSPERDGGVRTGGADRSHAVDGSNAPMLRSGARRVVMYAAAAASAVAILTLGAALLLPGAELSVALVTFAAVLLAGALPIAVWIARRPAPSAPVGQSAPARPRVVPDQADATEPRHTEAERRDAAEAASVGHRPALPTAATPFIGRERELEELIEMLRGSPMRLVTVTGTGGVGKTRLALQAARDVAGEFADGVAYVALSGLAAADLVVPSIADALGLQLSRREDPVAEVIAFLRDKQLLLVLDNFEHLTPAAGALSTILDAAPAVRMIATSRERLNLQHETLVVLEGLDRDGDDADSIALFVAGARRLERSFALDDADREHVARICSLLGGIPLAIELASAWVRTLSCEEILHELQRGFDVLTTEAPDLEPRHHSLRATFDASWRLLSPAEQTALARLGVFRSAFDRPAAERVSGAGPAVLRQLVDKSLLTRTDDRLLMLDVVRTYALERLAADPTGERTARESHLSWFVALLGSLHDGVQRADATAIQRVADSIDDVRAAWAYATQTCNAGALLGAASALYHFYESRGWALEGAEAFCTARSAFGDGAPSDTLARQSRLAAARLDVRHGVFLHRLGDLQSAEKILRANLPVLRDLDDADEVVFALHRLGAVRHGMGDYGEAERLHREGWERAREAGDRLAIGWSMTYLGNVAWSRGDFGTATQLYTDALSLLREENDLNGMWVTLNNLGVIAASRQQYDEAQRRFREGLALQGRLKNTRFMAHLLHNLGSAARELSDNAKAREWLEASLETSQRMGYESMSGLSQVGLAQLALRENDKDAAAELLHKALRAAEVAANHPLALEALLVLAELRLSNNDVSGARELARVVAVHPSSDRDVKRRVDALFLKLGADPPTDTQHGDVDLMAVVRDIDGGLPSPGKRSGAVTGTQPLQAATTEDT